MGVEVFPIVDLSAPPDMSELRELCRRFDVVIANTLVMWSAVQASHQGDVPVIWFIHESQVARHLVTLNPAIKSSLMMANRLVMPTQRTALLYREFTPRAIEVVPYGIPAVKCLADNSQQQKRTTFLLLGSYERRKGQDTYLDAIRLIAEKTRQLAIFRAAGRVLETDFYQALSRQSAGMPPVELLGALEHEDALKAIAHCDVLVCASRDETMPIAILEAMSLGRAIISTDVGGISEWLQNNVNGLLVPAEDRAALGQAMVDCLEQPDRLTTLGQNAARTFAQSFSIQRLGDTFSYLIESVRRDR
jgi:glycosyltransferase involved in cell wall biosynthesis